MTRIPVLLPADAATLLAPTHADRSFMTKGKNISGTPVFTQSSTSYRGGYRSLTNIPDYVEYEEVLTAGTYTLAVEYAQATSGGAGAFTVDGAQSTALDTYGASALPIRVELPGLIIATTGKHLVRFTVGAKNASSSATTCRISGYTLTRTGA